MGGIAGLIHLRGPAPDRALVERMSLAVAHRGPDDAGLWAEGEAAIAHRRIALTVHGRAQPVVDAERALVLDGRIYELGALQERLRREGQEPGGWDAEVALASLARWGDEALSKLHGDWALAVWNRRTKRLFLARDPMGVRPLYYATHDGKVAFASDLRALLLLPWVSREVATDRLAEYLSFRYTHAPRTLLRDVMQLPAGCVLRADADGVRVDRWSRYDYAAPDASEPSEDEARDQLERALRRAVERRLPTDQPAGVLLSGGTASTAIAALAVERSRNVRSFNVAFDDEAADEGAFAGRVASLLGVQHETVHVTREGFVASLEETVDAMGAPPPSPAAIPQLLICRAARLSTRVALSGDGGDELLGGVRATSLPVELRTARLKSHLPPLLRRLTGPSGLEPGAHFGLRRLIGGSKVFGGEERGRILRDPSLQRPGMRLALLSPLYDEVTTDPINEVLHVYLRGWLAEDSLARADRVSMLAGLELRFPLLDPDVVRVCHSLPGSAKIKRRRGVWHPKWPLKRLLAARGLPDAVVWRPKGGLSSPLNRWLRGEGEATLWDRVESVCADPLGLFQGEAIRELARAHARGEADHGAKLWTLIFLDMWLRRQVLG